MVGYIICALVSRQVIRATIQRQLIYDTFFKPGFQNIDNLQFGCVFGYRQIGICQNMLCTFFNQQNLKQISKLIEVEVIQQED